MGKIVPVSYRIEEELRDYLRDRAKRSDRSMNGELSAILRELKEKEAEASE